MSDKRKVSADIAVAAVAVIVVAGGAAWFVLGGDEPAELSSASGTVAEAETVAEPAAAPVEAAVGESAQVTLNKARMALNADMLAEPPGQNALYFYSLALEADPENQEISDELNAVADTVSGMIRGHLENGNLAAAQSLVQRLELAVPDAAAIGEYGDAVARRQREVLDRAMEAARAGNERQAQRLLAQAGQLPDADAAEVALARREIAEVAQALAEEAERVAAAEAAQRAAEQEAAEQAAAAAAAAAPEPAPAASALETALAAIREHIAAGQLTGSDSAQAELVAAKSSFADADEITEVERVLVAAVERRAQREIAFEQLVDAEDSITALGELGADTTVADLSAALDEAYIRREGARVIPANDLSLVEAVPPVYPRAALRRDQEGWVEVEFTVNAEGRTENIEVVATADTAIFNKATINAVQQWQFEPRIFRGQAIDQRVMTRVVFQLTGS